MRRAQVGLVAGILTMAFLVESFPGGADHPLEPATGLLDTRCDTHTCAALRLDDGANANNRFDTTPAAGAAAALFWGADAVWTRASDGPGSGLDADFVDGLDSAQILHTDETGSLSIPGRLGVGTTNLQATLSVQGDAVISQNLAIGVSSDPLRTLKVVGSAQRRALKVETFDGTPADINYRLASVGKEWFVGISGDADFDFFDAQGGKHPLTLEQGTGNVGVGTGSPTARLDVAGGLRLRSLEPGLCDSTTAGTIQYVAGGPGVADALQVCLKDGADAFSWRVAVSG